jgi:hypothetical protein
MNKSTSYFSFRHALLIIGTGILVLSGFGFLYSVLTGDSSGLKAWLLPLGPWCAALIGVRVMQKHTKNENDVLPRPVRRAAELGALGETS